MTKKTCSLAEERIKTALFLYDLGMTPYPRLPNTDVLPVEWDDWLNRLSADQIQQHWKEHPEHGLACAGRRDELTGPVHPHYPINSG